MKKLVFLIGDIFRVRPGAGTDPNGAPYRRT